MTLVEVLVVLALIGVMTGGIILGAGAMSQSRLKRSAVMLTGAVRVAYNFANATSRPARLVLDFDTRTVSLEQGEGPMLLRRGEKTGGAADAEQAEQQATQAGETLAEGPKAPRASFQPVSTFGVGSDADPESKTLSAGVRFKQVEVEHEDDPVSSGRAYLYFWPGGQAERSAIQLMVGSDPETVEDGDVITLVVSPLTGKVEIVGGPMQMPRPQTDEEQSEREDNGR